MQGAPISFGRANCPSRSRAASQAGRPSLFCPSKFPIGPNGPTPGVHCRALSPEAHLNNGQVLVQRPAWPQDAQPCAEARIRQQLMTLSNDRLLGSYGAADSFRTWSDSMDMDQDIDGGNDSSGSSSGGDEMSTTLRLRILSHRDATASQPRPPTDIYQGYSWVKGPKGGNKNRPFQDRLTCFNQYALEPGRSSAVPSALEQLACAGTPLCVTAVYDGHGLGEHAPDRAAALTLPELASNELIMNTMASPATLSSELEDQELANITVGMSQLFHAIDAHILQESEARGHLNGTTALLTVACGSRLYTSNAGDSRAVLSRGGMAMRVSRDHTPALSQERARIVANGGVVVGNARTEQRVVLQKGYQRKSCALSRALGDRDFKDAGLIVAQPDVCATVLRPGRDEFVIAASDGLWCVLDDQAAVDVVSRVVGAAKGIITGKGLATLASRQLLELAVAMGSTDDITVVVNMFNWGAREESA